MLTRIKCFAFLFVLQCPPSLMIPLAQQDPISTSNANNLVVQITPNISKATELIQQIDVKDVENQVISNINHVAVGDDSNNKLLSSVYTNNSGTNNLAVTTTLNPNAKIPGLHNQLANETQANALNTIANGTETNGNVTSIHNNVSTDLTETTILLENIGQGLPTRLDPTDEGTILNESLINGKTDIAWRSDIPVGKKKKVIKNIASLNSLNASLKNNNTKTTQLYTNNTNDSVHNNDSDLLISKYNSPVDKTDTEKVIFVIINSGNISDISANSLGNNGNLQTKSNTNEKFNKNLELITDFVNTTINNVLSSLLNKNISTAISKNIFLLLNSGSISNLHVNSPVLEYTNKNVPLKDRSRRHLDDSNTNSATEEPLTFKPPSYNRNTVIDVKFRRSGSQNQDNNTDGAANNSSLDSSRADNANSNNTVVENPVDGKDIPSAEAPAFRSLIQDKIRKLKQASKAVTEPNENKEHNLVLKLLPEYPPLTFDLNQLPLNNLLGGALNFMNRFKRSANEKENYPWQSNCKFKQIHGHTVQTCKKTKDLTVSTRKSLDDNISKVLKLFNPDYPVCAVSAIVKLYARQVLDEIAKSYPDGLLNQILTSFLEDKEHTINLVTTVLPNLPIYVMLRLQLVHGKTKEFMEQLSNVVDATLCSL